MIDPNPRLEAVAKAAQWRSPYNYSPTERAVDFLAMYDAIRAFDEQGPSEAEHGPSKAEFEAARRIVVDLGGTWLMSDQALLAAAKVRAGG